jgi:hypothetical protein
MTGGMGRADDDDAGVARIEEWHITPADDDAERSDGEERRA